MRIKFDFQYGASTTHMFYEYVEWIRIYANDLVIRTNNREFAYHLTRVSNITITQ